MRSCALSILIVLSSVGMAFAKPTDYKLATARTSVLGDHLSLTLGAGMKIEPRGHSIMAADASNEDETRGVLDNGKMRLVMMAYELYEKRRPTSKPPSPPISKSKASHSRARRSRRSSCPRRSPASP